VTSRRASSYVVVAFLAGLLIIPWAPLAITDSLNTAAVLVLLLYSLPLAAFAGYGVYCIVTNRAWQLTVTSKRVTWDRAFARGVPQVVMTRDILRLSVARSDTDGGAVTTVTLHLRDGSEREIPTMFTASPDDAALVQAIQRAVPKVFTRHLS
jgi:hypothetical protein